ncbi:head-tail connector protein [Cupriavidus basilensis]|uniref:head-tail connector protein n=1 Tax=Cupriavidus basilensis TaxID=68895 RepID=UPI00157A391D|nr:head-tail connector protein [Cupriavidus basilensis]NUA26110.1 hypothetical protein [Cupriavidus basilensis]
MGLRRTTQPVGEPVSLEEAKLHLRVDHDDEDDRIKSLIVTARMDAERRLRRTLLLSGWTLTCDDFGALYELPMAPLVAVTSIAYVDAMGAPQVLAPTAYRVDPTSEPGRVVRVSQWPFTARQPAAVTVIYTAGYAVAADVPAPIRQWILLAVGDLYANREASAERPKVPQDFADRLLDPYKIWG